MASTDLYTTVPGPQKQLLKLKLKRLSDGMYVHSGDNVTEQKTMKRGIAASVPATSADQSGSALAVTLAPAAGLIQHLVSITLSCGATAQLFTITEETAGTVIEKLNVPANTFLTWTPIVPIALGVAAKRFMVQTGASGVISVLAHYYDE